MSVPLGSRNIASTLSLAVSMPITMRLPRTGSANRLIAPPFTGAEARGDAGVGAAEDGQRRAVGLGEPEAGDACRRR